MIFKVNNSKFKTGALSFKLSLAKELAEKQAKIVQNIIEDLVQATPIDSGFARSRWQKVRIGNGEWRIVNDTSYINQLNAGSSRQAPEFFVERIALRYGKPNGQIVNYKSDGLDGK